MIRVPRGGKRSRTVGCDEHGMIAHPAMIDVLKAARPSVFMGVNTLYAGLAALQFNA